MRKLIPALALAGALFVSACAPSLPPTYWAKTDGTTGTWQQDRYDCERDTRMTMASFGRTPAVREILADRFFDRCLIAKGYSRTQ